MKTTLLCLMICFMIISCSTPSTEEKIELKPGENRLMVDGGEIWYKVSGSVSNTPVVLLHGGPGFNSFYLKPFDKLSDERPVIRYDQLGSGKSAPTGDTTKFTVTHYVAELEALREHLGIDTWHVYGHSWGTMLAMSYYNKYPDRVSTLTLASPCLSSEKWAESTTSLLAGLPDSLQQAVNRAAETGNYDDEGYQNAMNVFYAKYVFGETYPQADFDSTMNSFSQAVYGHMWGPSEFSITGTLRDFDVTGDLKNITVPTLFTVGEYDEIHPEIVTSWAQQVPDSRVVIFEGSSHLTPWNAEDESVEVQRMFLKESQSAPVSE